MNADQETNLVETEATAKASKPAKKAVKKATKKAVKKATKKAVKKVTKKAVKKDQNGVREGTIASTIVKGLKADKEPAAVLEMVKKAHKGCATTIACVYWYKSRIATGMLKA